MAARRLHCAHHLGARGHRRRTDAEGLGQLDEIRREDRRALVVLLVKRLLPLANHAQVTIVDDGDINIQLLLGDRGQLGTGHLKSAVAGDGPHFLARAGDLGADGRG
jgi:hypothetical protein